MRKMLVTLVAIVIAAGLVVAQEKAATKKPKERRISGEIVGVDEAKSTIQIKRGNDNYIVTFNDATKWTKPEGAKVVDAQRSDFKAGMRVICLANADEKGNLVARRIDLRPSL